MSKKIYADHAATTKLSDRALDVMMPYLTEKYQNPSTLYSSAHAPRKAIEIARKTIADCIGALPEEIFFTSGGTESDNWAIKSIFFGRDNRKKVITSEIEHNAVLNSCKVLEKLGYHMVYLPVDNEGIIREDVLQKELNEETAMVSIMMVNNEIGTLQNIKKLSLMAHQYGALFHTDAVQAVGHIEVNVNELDVDMLSASAHKFNGPKGVGFLYKRKGIELSPFITGGGQELGKRAGTENVPCIVGMAEALKENVTEMKKNIEHLTFLESRLLDGLRKNNIDHIVNGSKRKSQGNISISFPDVDGEVIMHRLDLKGIEIATGSACDSKTKQISHVIRAIGIPDKYKKGTIRISLGAENSKEEVEVIIKELISILRTF